VGTAGGFVMMEKSTGSGKIVKNATWLIACKVVQSLLSFVIGTLSARYLGPGNYGIIEYAAAIVSFMVPVVQLGLRSTLVHEIIASPDKEGETLGTALFMSTASSFLGIIGVLAFTAIANPNDPETMLVCALYSISLVFQATEMLQYWFQAKLLSKYTALTSLTAYVIVLAYRCFLLITQKSVYWFAFSQALDYLLISICLYGIYRKISSQKLKVSFSLAKQLFKRSRYYIVSGIMVTFFSLTDRVMITLMLGKEANGYYSAAVSCAALSQFVFAAIVDSMRPSILEAKKVHSPDYNSHIARLYSMIVYLALLQSTVLTAAAPLVIRIIYGTTYAPASSTLRIITWYTAFSYMGSVRNIWILAEQKQKMLWKINLSGALLNVIANYILIPIIGINGAAIASVAAQLFVNFALCFIVPSLRPVGRMILEGIDPRQLRRLWSGHLSNPFRKK
jgi:O-antigen/teichoic acid export membrane protein